ncbi:MAG: hypothetical protein Q7S53_04680 [bacterium]|nr:hypothetical protein [bacterium]
MANQYFQLKVSVNWPELDEGQQKDVAAAFYKAQNSLSRSNPVKAMELHEDLEKGGSLRTLNAKWRLRLSL